MLRNVVIRWGMHGMLAVLAMACVFAQSPGYVQIVDKTPATAKPAEYYIIKLKYLSVDQVAALFKEGGPYARGIPATVESIAGIPALQSVALKTTNPQDVLTVTRLIAQLDHPAKSFTLCCTVLVTDGNQPPIFPTQGTQPQAGADSPAEITDAALLPRLRQLVSQRQASIIVYPELQLHLNERGEILPLDSPSTAYFIRDGVLLRPSPLFPAMPIFRFANIQTTPQDKTTCQFNLLSVKTTALPGGSPNFSTDKTDTLTFTANTTQIAYTGYFKSEQSLFRIYLLANLRK